MLFLITKLLLSAIIIVIVSELAKRTGWLGGMIASLPLLSILSLAWLYLETKDIKIVSDLSYSILWFILPSLILFIILPILLKKGMPFNVSMIISCLFTMIAYAGFSFALHKLGVKVK